MNALAMVETCGRHQAGEEATVGALRAVMSAEPAPAESPVFVPKEPMGDPAARPLPEPQGGCHAVE